MGFLFIATGDWSGEGFGGQSSDVNTLHATVCCFILLQVVISPHWWRFLHPPTCGCSSEAFSYLSNNALVDGRWHHHSTKQYHSSWAHQFGRWWYLQLLRLVFHLHQDRYVRLAQHYRVLRGSPLANRPITWGVTMHAGIPWFGSTAQCKDSTPPCTSSISLGERRHMLPQCWTLWKHSTDLLQSIAQTCSSLPPSAFKADYV